MIFLNETFPRAVSIARPLTGVQHATAVPQQPPTLGQMWREWQKGNKQTTYSMHFDTAFFVSMVSATVTSYESLHFYHADDFESGQAWSEPLALTARTVKFVLMLLTLNNKRSKFFCCVLCVCSCVRVCERENWPVIMWKYNRAVRRVTHLSPSSKPYYNISSVHFDDIPTLWTRLQSISLCTYVIVLLICWNELFKTTKIVLLLLCRHNKTIKNLMMR